MTPARFTALWLVGQFMLLVVLFHAGPWPWASRSLSMLAALIPAWALLLRAGWRKHQIQVGVAATVTLVAALVAAANVATPLGSSDGATIFAYRAYAWTYVAAQFALVWSWLAWWQESALWPAFGGGLLATIGALISSWTHGMRTVEDILAMQPWTYMWSGDHGPIDVISRVAPDLVTVEVGALGGASLVLAAIAWRKE